MRKFLPLFLGAAMLATPVVSATSASAAPATSNTSATPLDSCTLSGATGATAKAVFVPTGITPDDAGDDTAGIQKAIDRAGAAGGGVVPIPAGTYVIDGHLQMRNGVALDGAGRTTVLKAGPRFLETKHWFGGYPLVTTTGMKNVTISDLSTDASGDVLKAANLPNRLTQWMVDVRRSSNVLIERVHTRNPFAYSIGVISTKNFCVKHSSTLGPQVDHYNQLDGIHINTSSFGDVVGNVVDQGTRTGGDDGLVAHAQFGDVHDIRYVANKVRGGDRGSGLQLAFTKPGARVYNITVQKNEFYGARWGGVRTGTYGSGVVNASNVLIGGAGLGNWFHDGTGNAVNLVGSVNGVTVTGNRACRFGTYVVKTGQRNTVSGNVESSTTSLC
ncbi:glycosyl hydrolase family 28-related protein [Kineococcus arenarius]|uniref:glycosyl hydrolase family 28-related protein n=1 Tax=unclassified Kineococcus TaxID=2621656 RepID=UPI003D7D8C5E